MTPGLLFGVLAAFFFSSTFILNRVMSLEGGHWVWSAGLRFGYMALILMIYQYARYGRQRLAHILKLLDCNWRFWMLTGSIGFGLFYALICFSATYAPVGLWQPPGRLLFWLHHWCWPCSAETFPAGD